MDFAPEDIKEDAEVLGPWKILIVDDDVDVHAVTKLVLKNFTFDGRGVRFLDASSGSEAIEVIKENPDIALAIVDVVMESNMAGLDLINYIRNDLGNSLIRLVLRTGQPGDAPQEVVIRDYEIDDYKSKTELSAQKLRTLMYASLRSYRDLHILDDNRKGLEAIIDGLKNLLDTETIQSFANATLLQLVSLLRLGKHALFAELTEDEQFNVIASVGALANFEGQKGVALPKAVVSSFESAIQNQRHIYDQEHIVSFFKSEREKTYLLYMHESHRMNNKDKRLIELYCQNVALALERVG